MRPLVSGLEMIEHGNGNGISCPRNYREIKSYTVGAHLKLSSDCAGGDYNKKNSISKKKRVGWLNSLELDV